MANSSPGRPRRKTWAPCASSINLPRDLHRPAWCGFPAASSGWAWANAKCTAKRGFYAGTMPRHKVWVDGFWMDRTEVTNAEFARFVDDTKYVTVAERWIDPGKFTDVLAKHEKRFRQHRALLVACQPDAGFPAALCWGGLATLAYKFPPSSADLYKPAKDIDPRTAHESEWWDLVDGACWKHPKGTIAI